MSIVEWENQLKKLPNHAQRVHTFGKVDQNGPERVKSDAAPTNLKNGKSDDGFIKKCFVWTFWNGGTHMGVWVEVVGRGHPWGGGKGVKLAKIEVLMEVVVKNDKNSKC